MFSCLVLVLALTDLGCSKKVPKDLETIASGTVTLDGKTLPMGKVSFSKADGTVTGIGSISSDGTYRAPGIHVGEAYVAVETSCFERTIKEAYRKAKGKPVNVNRPRLEIVRVPRRYEDPKTSNLIFEVKKGENPINIELTSK